MTLEKFEHYLAMITLAMPIVLTGAHSFLSIAQSLHAQSKKSKSKTDDKVTQVILNIATWLHVLALAIAHCASMGFFRRDTSLNPTPSLERVEQEERDV